MGIDRTIDITPDQRKTLLSLLEGYLPNTAVWVYGSRVKWTSRPQSDLDLVVFATPEQERRVSDLREAFEESSLPFRVDLFVWDCVPEQFHKQIEADHVVLAEKKEQGGGGEWRETVYGRFSSDFVEDCLVNLCDQINGVQTGPFGSQLHKKDYVSSGTPIITVEHLGDNRILHEDIPYVSDHDRERLSKYSLHNGDIVFSRVGSVDRRALVRKAENGWLFSGRCLRVRPDPNKIDSAYLSYFFGLPSFKEHVRAIAVGATMPSLNTQILSDIVVPHPCDLTEQRAISHILGTLDDKIELNRRMNETLEAMARALFKSWFVDFDPVRAKAALKRRAGGENDWTLERARAYLDNMGEEIAALFPDSFVDSELGEIPEGWGVGTVSQLAERIQNGGTPKRSEPTYWECGEIPWLTSGEVRQSFILGTQNFISEEGLAKSSAKMVPARSILVALYGATAGQVSMNYQPLSTNQAVSAVIPSTGNRYFCLISLKLEVSELENRAVGSAQQNISKKIVEDTIVLLPHIKLRSAYDALVEPLFDRNFHNLDENQTLATLRDMLLPKLVSGEIRLRDVERFAEVAQ